MALELAAARLANFTIQESLQLALSPMHDRSPHRSFEMPRRHEPASCRCRSAPDSGFARFRDTRIPRAVRATIADRAPAAGRARAARTRYARPRERRHRCQATDPPRAAHPTGATITRAGAYAAGARRAAGYAQLSQATPPASR